jgi:hypothetical protein
MRNMIRHTVSLVRFVALAAGAAGLALLFHRGFTISSAQDRLAVAEILVGAATFASVVFGAFAYLEATVLRARVDDAHTRFDRLCKEMMTTLAELDETYRERYYQLSVQSAKALMTTVLRMSKPGDQEYRTLVNNLRESEFQMHFQRGSYASVRLALEIAYKYFQDKFLLLDDDLRKVYERWKPEERETISREFLEWKRRAVAFRLKTIESDEAADSHDREGERT